MWMADCVKIRWSCWAMVKGGGERVFVLCVWSFHLFLFKHQSFNLWADPTAEVMLRSLSEHLTYRMQQYTPRVIWGEEKEGKQKLTLYPQALRDPILLGQEWRNSSYNKPHHSSNNTTGITFHLTMTESFVLEIFVTSYTLTIYCLIEIMCKCKVYIRVKNVWEPFRNNEVKPG